MNENNNSNKKGSGNSIFRLLVPAIIVIIIIIVIVRFTSGGCGGDGPKDYTANNGATSFGTASYSPGQYTGSYYTGSGTDNTGIPNYEVTAGVPEKRTQILGNGQDVATVMVYICGSDLESGGGAATMDIKEMLNAGVGDHVNLILYTGGTTEWQNRQMSSSVNQIYQISGNSLYLLENNAGNKNMTDPDTLTEFIRYCSSNFPANRNMLILWDHGGGSVTGYGSDEKFSYSGTMDLTKIRTALRNAGTSFDFIGFDACLMATVETGLVASEYADYLIASEETESGYGWYYTNWLAELSDNPSISTVDLGQRIVDDFIRTSAQAGQGWAGTQSVVDLAELSYTVPSRLEAFGTSTAALIESEGSGGDYKTVSNARAKARSFGDSFSIDQVDLVDFAERLGTAESMSLAKAVRDAVKYNNTTRDMTSSYGLSVYFPYANSKYVKNAGKVYDQIGIPSEYTRCVQSYAAMGLSGQYISGGSGDPFNSLFGIFGSGDYGDSYFYGNSSGSSYSSSSIADMLGELMGGSLGGFSSDYDISDFSFFRSNVNLDAICGFLEKNQFDETKLEWKENAQGTPVISMPQEQWDLVHSIELNMFYDDGEEYIDLGSDNVFEFDEQGNLLGVNDNTWLTVDGHYMAYYYDSMTVNEDRYLITGHSPILYNGKEAELILNFDQEHPYGYIAGVRYLEETETPNIGKLLEGVVDKNDKADLETGGEIGILPAVKEGDRIEFLADFYDYQGNFLDSFVLGEAWTVTDQEPQIANMDLGEGSALAMYCFTDIYHKKYWTGVIPEKK